MSFFRSVLALTALACADPGTLVQPKAAVVPAPQDEVSSSYSVGAADRTMYVRFSAPRGVSGESPYRFVERMFASADSAAVERLVIDLRSVSGSDTRLVVPLTRGILMRDRFTRRGGLYVVVGAESYSASQNVATLLSRYAEPSFVSEYSAK